MQKKQTLFYCKYSDTIRQAPENYCIACKNPRHPNTWMMDFDLASNKDLVIKVTLELFNFDSRYATGEKLIEKLS